MRRAQWLRQGGFIYLRTGGNGCGKTLFTLKDVRDMQLKENRPVYFVDGRFTPKAIITDEFGWKPIKFEDWEQCEQGAIILCDEVHYDLPQRAQTKAPPLHIQRLTEHRKFGFDFFMLTQHPSNFDAFVRKLVQAPGYHQHFKRILGGTASSSVLQWDAVNLTCERDGSGRSAQITNRAFPKEVYDWYESAQKHTAKVRIPKQLYTLIGCVLALILVIYLLVNHFMPGTTGSKPKDEKPASTAPVSGAVSQPSHSTNERKPMTAYEYAAAYQPRIARLQHTAPAYDELTRPQRVPVPAACVNAPRAVRQGAASGCKCYTQDGTPYTIDEPMCLQLVAHGIFLGFNADPNKQQSTAAPPVQTPAPGSAAAPGGGAPGLLVIGEPVRPHAPGANIVAAADEGAARPRVPASSPWSFEAGR